MVKEDTKGLFTIEPMPESPKGKLGGARNDRYDTIYNGLSKLAVGTTGKVCLSKEEKDNVSNVRIGLINRDKDGIIELFIKNPTYVEKTSKDKKKYKQFASGAIFF